MRAARRIRHHLWITAAVLLGAMLISDAYDKGDLRQRFSLITAQLSMVLLALSLMLGPLNVVRDRANPVSTDLRRDIGIWGGILALVHFGLGLGVHMKGKMLQYFVPPPEWGSRMPLRLDPFGIANDLGLLSGVVLLVLLVISSDVALRRLGRSRWKRWQRANYIGAAAAVLHGLLYQSFEKRSLPLVLVFVGVSVAALVAQGLGILARRRHPPASDALND